jgi:hypothetical protein
MTLCRGPWLTAALLAASLVAVAAPGLAHSPAGHATPVAVQTVVEPDVAGPSALPAEPAGMHALRAEMAPPALPAAVALAVLLVVAIAAGRRPRLAVSAIAVLALVVLAFETGLHSVHHLGDERGAAECSVASGTTHLAGTTDGPPLGGALLSPTFETIPAGVTSSLPRTPLRLHSGRSPPRTA